MNSIFTRRSVRQFAQKTVEPEKIDKMLRAGMQAPSAYNQQCWEFIVVRGVENLEELSKIHQYSACLKGADVGIIILGNKDKMKMPYFWEQDLGACTQNVMLQATELGLGTVWFGTAPVEEHIKFVRDLYDLGENLVPYSILAVGYPQSEDANKFVDRFDETKIRYIG
ncbi:MAG: nitroreductase [Epulopiscium sp. Nele67-Bin005]|nr:MAG: nitroreductase [Epulopiscium sp. Nele67-Bin005]